MARFAAHLAFQTMLCCIAAITTVWAQGGAPNPPPPPPPNPNWQDLLGADPVFKAAVATMTASEKSVVAALPLPPSSGRPSAAPDWEPVASACAAFLNLYKLTGDQQYKTSAKQIADNLMTWNDWLVANREASIPYLGWGPAVREAEFGCPAISGYFADDLWDTSAGLRCLLKYSETDPNPSSTPYFERAKKIIDAWPFVDRSSGDPNAPALANDGPYAAAGLRFYRKSNDPCEIRYVKNTNIVFGEQLFRIYRITDDAQYLDAATRVLNSQLWDILTHSNFGYNSYMIYDDISNPVYAQTMVPANENEINHTNGALICKDRMNPPTDTSCWNHLGFEGFAASVIEQLVNDIDAAKFPVASTFFDLAAATDTTMAHYRLSAFGDATRFDWAGWLASGAESPTHVTAYNCAQRFSSDPTFYSQCLDALKNDPTYSKMDRGTVLYSLVPEALFTPNLAQGAVVNAGSGVNTAVSPGEIIAVFGAGIGPTSPAGLQLDANGNVSTNLASVRVLFDGVPAPILYTSSTQTNAVVPYEIANQSMTEMQVEYNGVKWKRYPLLVAPSTPALFTANSSGQGQAAILNQDLSINSSMNPAKKGSIVVLYATGAGQTTPAGVDGLPANGIYPKPLLDVSVTIGGQPATISYAGAAPALVAGVLQINCQIPQSIASGDAGVVLTIGKAGSPAGVTVAVQ